MDSIREGTADQNESCLPKHAVHADRSPEPVQSPRAWPSGAPSATPSNASLARETPAWAPPSSCLPAKRSKPGGSPKCSDPASVARMWVRFPRPDRYPADTSKTDGHLSQCAIPGAEPVACCAAEPQQQQ